MKRKKKKNKKHTEQNSVHYCVAVCNLCNKLSVGYDPPIHNLADGTLALAYEGANGQITSQSPMFVIMFSEIYTCAKQLQSDARAVGLRSSFLNQT